MDECELVAFVSALACGISKCFSTEDISIMAVVFTQLGDTLATILLKRELNENKSVKENKGVLENKCDSNNKRNIDTMYHYENGLCSDESNNSNGHCSNDINDRNDHCSVNDSMNHCYSDSNPDLNNSYDNKIGTEFINYYKNKTGIDNENTSINISTPENLDNNSIESDHLPGEEPFNQI